MGACGRAVARSTPPLVCFMNAVTRTIVALVVSTLASVVLVVGASMASRACHCMTPQFTLFPYGTYLWERFSSSGGFGLALVLLQFPLYVFLLMRVRGIG